MAAKNGIGKWLDQLVDDDGLKTEITITLTDQTLAKVSAYLIGTIVIGSIAFFAIRGIANQMEVKKQIPIQHA